MNPNEQLIYDFYSAFQARDGGKMVSFYHPNVDFSDAAFGELHGRQATAMWRMLCARGADLKIAFERIHADDKTGSAHWEAWYTFSATGRKVHNVIEATFAFKDGKIIEHRDRFNFWRWATQALGPLGLLLGWTPYLQGKVRAQALSGLEAFMKKNA